MSPGQQHRAEGLRALVVGRPVLVCVSVPPAGLPAPAAAVRVAGGAAHLPRVQGARSPPAHDDPRWPGGRLYCNASDGRKHLLTRVAVVLSSSSVCTAAVLCCVVLCCVVLCCVVLSLSRCRNATSRDRVT